MIPYPKRSDIINSVPIFASSGECWSGITITSNVNFLESKFKCEYCQSTPDKVKDGKCPNCGAPINDNPRYIASFQENK